MLLTLEELPKHVVYLIKGVRTPTVTHLRRPVKYKNGKKWSWKVGICTWCRKKCEGRRTCWCSEECVNSFLALRNQVWLVRERDNNKCQTCGASPVEVDHIIPVCEGGLTIASNLRSLCRTHHQEQTNLLRKRLAKGIDNSLE